jgi:hypothetical protein
MWKGNHETKIANQAHVDSIFLCYCFSVFGFWDMDGDSTRTLPTTLQPSRTNETITESKA